MKFVFFVVYLNFIPQFEAKRLSRNVGARSHLKNTTQCVSFFCDREVRAQITRDKFVLCYEVIILRLTYPLESLRNSTGIDYSSLRKKCDISKYNNRKMRKK